MRTPPYRASSEKQRDHSSVEFLNFVSVELFCSNRADSMPHSIRLQQTKPNLQCYNLSAAEMTGCHHHSTQTQAPMWHTPSPFCISNSDTDGGPA
ncbi:hypothetical protein Pelo_5943 [Pelomyxa schiedti]|nr:hypothetical protein Pelo_5943 [Pelomyxa schiedti]